MSAAPVMTTQTAYRHGVLAMSASMAVLLVNDSLVKLVTARAPSDQIIFTRGVFVCIFILIWLAVFQRQVFPFLKSRIMVGAGGRAVLDSLASFTWVASLIGLPLANGTAITLAGPLILTGLAMLWLGERVGWRHWAATLGGLAGVLLIIQPSGEAFNWFSLLALASALFTAARDALTRSIVRGLPSILLTFATGVTASVLSGISGLWRGWPPMAWSDVGLLALAAVSIIAAQQFTIYSLKVAEASAVAPFRYTSMLWAMLSGYLLWGDVPNALAFGGSAIVVLSGLYLLHNERMKYRAEVK